MSRATGVGRGNRDRAFMQRIRRAGWGNKTLIERLREKVSPEPNSGCWLWTGFVNPNGYGIFRTGEHTRLAHRVSYELHIGPIPKGLQLDHLCRVRCCVNPAHLEPVTQRENTLRGVSPSARHAKKTHCPKGHAYDEANTYRYQGGRSRYCRACRKEINALGKPRVSP